MENEKYEYTSHLLVRGGGSNSDHILSSDNINQLNKLFTQGWEYIETVNQNIVGLGSSGLSKASSMIVFLRRKKKLTEKDLLKS